MTLPTDHTLYHALAQAFTLAECLKEHPTKAQTTLIGCFLLGMRTDVQIQHPECGKWFIHAEDGNHLGPYSTLAELLGTFAEVAIKEVDGDAVEALLPQYRARNAQFLAEARAFKKAKN